MRHPILIALAALLLALGLSGAANAGPFQDGMAAYERGDYATAFRLWRPLADQGNARAQVILGSMLEFGQGVPQNHAEAVKWYRLAADQGNAHAQVNLGGMYYTGQGVPQDHVQAHKWFNLAGTGGVEDGRKGRDILAKQMTPAQIAEAQRLALEWKPKQ